MRPLPAAIEPPVIESVAIEVPVIESVAIESTEIEPPVIESAAIEPPVIESVVAPAPGGTLTVVLINGNKMTLATPATIKELKLAVATQGDYQLQDFALKSRGILLTSRSTIDDTVDLFVHRKTKISAAAQSNLRMRGGVTKFQKKAFARVDTKLDSISTDVIRVIHFAMKLDSL
jgi:hypothetical protein